MIGQDFVNESVDNLGIPNEYAFDISSADGNGGEQFASPPVRVLIQFSKQFTDIDLQDLVARYSLMNRKIDVFLIPKEKVVTKDLKNKEVITYKKLQPVPIGGFVFNSMDSAWEAYPILTEHPLVLSQLFEITTAYHLKNLLPSQN